MENHVHLLASSADMAKEIGDFKSFTARMAIDWYIAHDRQWALAQLLAHRMPHKTGQTYQFWQDGAHPQWIQGEDMLRNKLEYIHNNPVKRGWVDDPAHWRYSSCRNYHGMVGVLPVEPLL